MRRCDVNPDLNKFKNVGNRIFVNYFTIYIALSKLTSHGHSDYTHDNFLDLIHELVRNVFPVFSLIM